MLKRIAVICLLALIVLITARPYPIRAHGDESAPTLTITDEIGVGLLTKPSSVAVDSHGNLFVVDSFNNRIQVFDGNGNLLRGWGKLGSGAGEFNLIDPREHLGLGDLAIDSADNVYVADAFNQRIQKFDNDGNFLLQWGGAGTNDGQFARPLSLAISTDDTVYVIDDRRSVVQVFDSQGNFLFKFGEQGKQPGQLNDSGNIAVDARGHSYVADYGSHRVEKFAHNGTFIKLWGSRGRADDQFYGPVGICVDSRGRVWVGDVEDNRLRMFDTNGNLLALWSNAEFGGIPDLTVLDDGTVYLADYFNDRVLKLKLGE